jgi:hypothetical protein
MNAREFLFDSLFGRNNRLTPLKLRGPTSRYKITLVSESESNQMCLHREAPKERSGAPYRGTCRTRTEREQQLNNLNTPSTEASA